MLSSKAPSPIVAKPSASYPREHAVWVIGGLRCPHCRRELKATDIDLDRFGGTVVCAGCHQDIARIERR